jgi:hypothetical protein
MAGWYGVTDMKPLKGGKWEAVKNPMLGVRFCEMDKGSFVNDSDDFIRWVEAYGYLAVRYATARYIYEEVPTRIFGILRKHRGASMYLRQQVVRKYPCVEIVKYETPEAYHADQGPVKEKLAAMAKKRLENVIEHLPMETNLFGEVVLGNHPKRHEKRLIGGWSFEEES